MLNKIYLYVRTYLLLLPSPKYFWTKQPLKDIWRYINILNETRTLRKRILKEFKNKLK